MSLPGNLWKAAKTQPWVLGIMVLLFLGAAVSLAWGSAPLPAPATQAVGAPVDRQVLEEVVNQALARELAPVKEMLSDLTVHRPSLPDIVGGLGYILGLFGLWAYFLSKRNKGS